MICEPIVWSLQPCLQPKSACYDFFVANKAICNLANRRKQQRNKINIHKTKVGFALPCISHNFKTYSSIVLKCIRPSLCFVSKRIWQGLLYLSHGFVLANLFLTFAGIFATVQQDLCIKYFGRCGQKFHRKCFTKFGQNDFQELFLSNLAKMFRNMITERDFTLREWNCLKIITHPLPWRSFWENGFEIWKTLNSNDAFPTHTSWLKSWVPISKEWNLDVTKKFLFHFRHQQPLLKERKSDMKMPNDVIKQVWSKNSPRFDKKNLLENQMFSCPAFFTMLYQSNLLVVLLIKRKVL